MIKRVFSSIIKPMPLDEYPDYDTYWGKRRKQRKNSPMQRAKRIARLIEPNSTVLDIGCGDGTLIREICQYSEPQYIVGIDISLNEVEKLKKEGFEAYQINIISMVDPKNWTAC